MPQYRLSMTFKDEADRSSNVAVYLDAADEADAMAGVPDILTYSGILSGARLESTELARILTDEVLPGVRTAVNLSGGARPLADHDVEKGGRFIFSTASNDKTRLTIPAFRGTFILPSGEIDRSAQPVIDFETEIVGGDAENEDGDDITGVIKAYKAFRDRGQP